MMAIYGLLKDGRGRMPQDLLSLWCNRNNEVNTIIKMDQNFLNGYDSYVSNFYLYHASDA